MSSPSKTVYRRFLCALIGHADRNYADEEMHYAYCIRCGKIFGHPWSSDKANKRAFDATMKVLRNMTLEEAAKLCELRAETLCNSDPIEAEHRMTLVLAAGSIRGLTQSS